MPDELPSGGVPGALPVTDTHIHATCYRAARARPEVTVQAVLARCAETGVERAGVVEHLGGPAHPPECLFDLARAFRATPHPVRAALGAEVNIRDDTGGLDGTAMIRESASLDFVLAGIHGMPPEIVTIEAGLELCHRSYLAAIAQNAWIDVIAHPWRPSRKSALRGGGPPWSFEGVPGALRDELRDALAGAGIAYEVHTSDRVDFNDPAFGAFIRDLAAAGVPLAVGGDSHDLESIGAAREICTFLDTCGVSPKQVWFPET